MRIWIPLVVIGLALGEKCGTVLGTLLGRAAISELSMRARLYLVGRCNDAINELMLRFVRPASLIL